MASELLLSVPISLLLSVMQHIFIGFERDYRQSWNDQCQSLGFTSTDGFPDDRSTDATAEYFIKVNSKLTLMTMTEILSTTSGRSNKMGSGYEDYLNIQFEISQRWRVDECDSLNCWRSKVKSANGSLYLGCRHVACSQNGLQWRNNLVDICQQRKFLCSFWGSTSVKGTDAIGLAATASNFPSSLHFAVELYSGAMVDVNVPVIQIWLITRQWHTTRCCPTESFRLDSVSS